MTPSIDQSLHQFANLLLNWTLIQNFTFLPNFGGFHRTLQWVRLANRGRLLLRTPGPVPFGTCICSNVETILSWTCHVYGPFEFRTSLGTSILLVIVPADKASNTFVCKKYYVDILIEKRGLHLLPGHPSYNLTDCLASALLDNRKLVLNSFGIQTNDEELDLPYIYWIPNWHKNPYKHRFNVGSSKCSTKSLSVLLTKLLIRHIKQNSLLKKLDQSDVDP